jgi:hypothetical protein
LICGRLVNEDKRVPLSCHCIGYFHLIRMRRGHSITQDQQATEKPALKTQDGFSAGQIKAVDEYNRNV